jgi:hypothetical protein
MGRSNTTKNKILGIINSHEQTLTDISKKLDLAPSTVSQHLKELKEIGAIEESDNWNMKKWKYYKLNPEFDYSKFGIEEPMLKKISANFNKRVFFYTVGLILTGVVLLSYLVLIYNAQSSSIVQIGLTDPPTVPFGTQALYINYSGIAVHTVGGVGPEWIETNSSGTVNLLSLINVSKIISSVEVSHNSKINEVSFKIDSAQIEIDNTTYNVVVPTGNITAAITENATINSSSEIILDFSPIVFQVYNGKKEGFLMLPGIKAILDRGMKTTVGMFKKEYGKNIALNREYYTGLRFGRYMKIVSVSILKEASGNISLSADIENTGDRNISLKNLVILNKNNTGIWSKVDAIAFSVGPEGNLTFINGTYTKNKYNQAFNGSYGYLLGPGKSVLLTFDGKLVLGNGSVIYPTEDTEYRTGIISNAGYYSMTNAT